MTALVWIRRDLRLADNPAWAAATHEHDEVTGLFVLEPGLWRGASSTKRAVLAGHLAALDAGLATWGGRLRVEVGDPVDVIPRVARQLDAERVYINSDYSPYATRRDEAIARHVTLERYAGLTVHAPGEITTAAGSPPRVFTPYWKRWQDRPWGLWPEPASAVVRSDPGSGIPSEATPIHRCGESAAQQRLSYLLERVDGYVDSRDRPDLDATSRLSADLHFGVLDPRRLRREVGESTPGRRGFVRQLCWRDFYMQVLWHHPRSPDLELRPEYRGMPWRDDPAGLEAWTTGRTGYPIIDAGMRQLQAEGFVHNRVRMLVASFLVKDLLIDWRHGERWFRRYLIDGDVAQNVGNWQWVAGTGTDAAPYFRVFNPMSQSKKFDPEGAYIRRYVPELSRLAAPAVHSPWEAGPLDLAAAGVTLGDTYPEPIVDHATARVRALEAYAAVRTAHAG